MHEAKWCANCKHLNKTRKEFPCNLCSPLDHGCWEPDIEPDKFNTEPPQSEQSDTVIQLNIGDGNAMSLANAICKYEREFVADIETALIFLDELSEHLDTYVRAERKWLEYQKSKEE